MKQRGGVTMGTELNPEFDDYAWQRTD